MTKAIFIFNDDLVPLATLRIIDGQAKLELQEDSVPSALGAYVDGLSRANPKLKHETREGRVMRMHEIEIEHKEDPRYLVAIEQELGAHGFMARLLPLGLREILEAKLPQEVSLEARASLIATLRNIESDKDVEELIVFFHKIMAIPKE